ncbi:MAG TPA: PQQ-dependent sugar dehydrogenase [Phycisphaerales bacterium]|nr:PQQ-dependent sugar dehydrogenase [Phycisphaerales bacterium]
MTTTFPKAAAATLSSLAALALVAGTARAQHAAPVVQGDIGIELQPIATGLRAPILVTHAGDGSGRLFIVDQAGTIRIHNGTQLLATPFLDLTSTIVAVNPGFDERGLLGLAFHPNYENNGRFFVRYSVPRTGQQGVDPCFGTGRGCHSEVLAEFTVSSNPNIANPTPTVLLTIPKPQFNHNSGDIAFGPDGFLYMGMGDGGGANDGLADNPPSHGPGGNGQNLAVKLGKVLRFDVSTPGTLAIPPSNPFVNTPGADPAIFAYGLRNPYRFSFDSEPGGDNTLYLADVGQNLLEEINIIRPGRNYGWVTTEGTVCFNPFAPNTPLPSCNTAGITFPIATFGRNVGIAVIGGFLYRGNAVPQLRGQYVFGDFSTAFNLADGHLFYMRPIPGIATSQIKRLKLGVHNRTFGQFLKGMGRDEQGELYFTAGPILGPTGNSASVYRMVAIPCGTADFNADGDTGTTADIEAFFDCLGGHCCPTCLPNADFNNDGDIGTDQDIESFFRVLGGGTC